MKFNTIFSLLAVTLASKVAAECFATKLGSPCCSHSTEVLLIDEDGKKWGIENGVKCGIMEVKSNVLQKKEKNSQSWSNYMNKIKPEEFCPVELTQRHDDVEYPEVKNLIYYSTTTEKDRSLIVLLPPNYTEEKKYPVVYYLHGIMTNGAFMLIEAYGTVAIAGNLFHDHLAKEMIIVLPDQYAPAPGTEVPPALNQEFFAGYNNFINDLVDDIMPYMEKNFSVATGRENTAICGFSFGGRNSLYIGFTRPDLFGYVGAFSPAPGLTPGDDALSGHHPGLFQEDELRSDIPHIVTMISCGTDDTVVGDFPKSYHKILTKNHQKHVWYEIPEKDHVDPESLTSGYYNFLRSIFGNLKSASSGNNNGNGNGNGNGNSKGNGNGNGNSKGNKADKANKKNAKANAKDSEESNQKKVKNVKEIRINY